MTCANSVPMTESITLYTSLIGLLVCPIDFSPDSMAIVLGYEAQHVG